MGEPCFRGAAVPGVPFWVPVGNPYWQADKKAAAPGGSLPEAVG